MPQTIKSLGEFGLIHSLKRFQGLTPRVVEGIGDDAAVLALDSKRYQLFTTDMLVEGVHFTLREPAKLIGHKALACNISDIAAMGGIPTSAVISIGLPPGIAVRYVQDIYAGMAALARKFKVSLVGGDTVKADQLVINVALLGEVEKKKLILRRGARPGDMILVSGPLGNTLKSGKHLKFMPRLKESRFLVEYFKPSAMMDISDGLAGDLGHILKASGVGAVLDADQIPRNPGATLDSALTGGEDFELLFTLPAAQGSKLMECAQARREFSFSPVGVVTDKVGACFLKETQGQLRPLLLKGYVQF